MLSEKQQNGVIRFIQDAVYPSKYSENWRVDQAKVQWHTLKILRMDGVYPVLHEFWPGLTQEVLTEIFNGFSRIRKVREGEYNIDRTGPQDDYYLRHHKSQYNRSKAGECPRCGDKVENKNRHNNKNHDGHTCRLSRVKKIMEM